MNGGEPATDRLRGFMERVYELKHAADTMDVIRTVDFLYNEIVDPQFEKQHGSLERVLAVTLEELTEFSWKDYLDEEALEETFSAYLDKVTESMTNLDMMEQEKQQEKEEDGEEETANRKKVLVVDENGSGAYVQLCTEKLWKDLSDRTRGKTSELFIVQGNSRGLQPVFHRGRFKESGTS